MSFTNINFRYPMNSQRYVIDWINTDLKRNFYSTQVSTLSPEEKKKIQLDLVKKAEKLMNQEKITGFNLWACGAGLVAFHVAKICYTKKLLYELGKMAIPHMALAVGVGIGTGFLFGTLFSYDFGVYFRYRRAKKTIDRLNNLALSKK